MTNHAILLGFGLIASCVQRRPEQILFAFFVAYLVELLIGKVRGDDWSKIKDRLKSSTVIVLGLLIFLLSRHWWFYGVAAVVAILSKTLLLRPNGQHVYNPTGFTILSMVAIFPHHVFIRGDQYNGYLFPYLLVLLLGTTATILVDRWRQTIWYIFGSFLASLLITAYNPQSELLRLFGPDFGVEGLLFMLLMFTDPKTSPRSHRVQSMAGFTIGLLNVSFRTLEFAYSQFLAIFIVASFIAPWFELLESRLHWPEFRTKLSKPAAVHFICFAVFLFPVAAWIMKVEAWPLTDYRMFAESKKVSAISALRFSVDGERIEIPKAYLGVHFLVDSLIAAKRIEAVKRVVRGLYREHVNNGGHRGNEFLIERVRLRSNGEAYTYETLLKYDSRVAYDK